MPWKSLAQMRAAYGGYLGAEMKQKAPQWSAETPHIKDLPTKVGTSPHRQARRAALLKQMKG